MKRYFIWILLLCMSHLVDAQVDVKKSAQVMQECLNMSNNGGNIKMFEQTGILEYDQNNTQQRIKLSDLKLIAVNKNESGYSVDIKCVDENGCINFIKNNIESSMFKESAIQFGDVTLANTFAENMSNICSKYSNADAPIEKKLFTDANGKTPLIGVKAVAITSPAAKATNKNIAKEEDEDENIEKDDIEKTSTKKQVAPKSENKKTIRNKKEKEENDDEGEVKLSAREKRKAARERDVENTDEADAPKEKTRLKRNSIIEDVQANDDDNTEDSKGGNDFCNQLKDILQSGKENKFKNIEGTTTNADTKINESKIKLKGTRRNYLSWYQQQRAFISELKSSKDYDQVYTEFENIQTTLDECLGGSWDMENKSNIEEYAKVKTEVKDVEFKNSMDKTMPTVRVIFLEDNNKFTLFLRVR